jgi:hypothetical protein
MWSAPISIVAVNYVKRGLSPFIRWVFSGNIYFQLFKFDGVENFL